MSLELEEHLVGKANRARIPLTANFELTPVCNLNCDMCFIRMSKQDVEQWNGLRSVDEWLEIARQLQQMGTLFILLTGGEPLLYPGFRSLYTELRNMGFIITINTNGTLITEDVCKMFAENKPRRVNVTLYGGCAETYRQLCHNANAFSQCMNALQLLRQHDIDTKLNVSIVEKNRQDFDAIMQKAKKLQIPAVVNSYMFPALRSQCNGCRNTDRERISPDEAAQYQEKYIRYRQELEGKDYHQYALHTVYSTEHDIANPDGVGLDCRAGKSSVWINWMQIMTPCVLMESPAADLKTTRVEDAWKEITDKAQRLPKHEECGNCKLRKLCQVCYAAACHEKATRGNLDYLCKMARQQYDIIQAEAQSTNQPSEGSANKG